MTRHRFCALLFVLAIALPAGCAVDSASIQIVERPNTLETRRYQETFDEAFYDLSPSGELCLVFRKRQPAGRQGRELTQTIVVETLWRSMPGVTIAHSTQINAIVTYGLAGEQIVQTLSGAGSVFFEQNDAGDRLTGTLPHVTLESKSAAMGDGFLQRVELCGEFSARRDSLQALRIANETKRLHQAAARDR